MLVTTEKCYLCGGINEFQIADGAKLLREATCRQCGASIRNSDTAQIIVKTLLQKDQALSASLAELKRFRIIQAASSGSIHRILKNLPKYKCFEYFPGIKAGKSKHGIRCDDLQSLSFNDQTVDLVITEDVLEHVERPDDAWREINRVLKVNGHHIFTVPVHEKKITKSRKKLPAVYHGDPLRNEGIIVQTDWGDDICQQIDQFEMSTEKISLHIFHDPEEITDVDASYGEYASNPALGYFQYNSVVFVSQSKSKKKNTHFRWLKQFI